MMKFKTQTMPIELMDFSTISIHGFFGIVLILVDLIDHDREVTVDE